MTGQDSQDVLGLEAGRDSRRDASLLMVAVLGSLAVHAALGLVAFLPDLIGEPKPGPSPAEASPPPVGIIPARLVRKGVEPEPHALPDRVVPALPTAPEEGVPVAKKLSPPPPRKRRPRKRPLNPVDDDKVRDVLSRIRAFGEITDHQTTIGDPRGVPGGDVTDPALAQAGSLWARQVVNVIKAYITFPTIIPDQELRRLRCKVEVKVGPDLVPREAKIAKRGTSHNRFFDQAVLDSFEQMRLKHVKLPRPPRMLEDALFGAGLVINIHGRDLEQ